MISQLYIFRSIYLLPLIVGVSLNIGCLTQADNDLKSEVENKTDNTYYRNGDFFTSTVSAHKSAPIKLRFNKIASAALVDGKIPKDVKFPDGSLVVKDIYSSDKKEIVGYSVMKKDSKHADQAEGWLWAEFSTSTGSYFNISITEKGSRCLGCHNNASVDRVQTFLVHP